MRLCTIDIVGNDHQSVSVFLARSRKHYSSVFITVSLLISLAVAVYVLNFHNPSPTAVAVLMDLHIYVLGLAYSVNTYVNGAVSVTLARFQDGPSAIPNL